MALFFDFCMIGAGLTAGFFGIVGWLALMYRATCWVCNKVVNRNSVQWEFGKRYNDYQSIILNNKKWCNQPSKHPNRIVLQDDNANVVTISSSTVDQSEATKQTETGELTPA